MIVPFCKPLVGRRSRRRRACHADHFGEACARALRIAFRGSGGLSLTSQSRATFSEGASHGATLTRLGPPVSKYEGAALRQASQ
jgi:hypothetical protein